MGNICKFVFFLLFITSDILFSQETTVTITNQNIGLVKEERNLKLINGRQFYNLYDIPAMINSKSVLIESDFNVLEQNFEYDLISVDKILQKSLEKEIVIEHPDQGKVEGILLSTTDNNLIIKTKDNLLQIIPRNTQQKISLKGISDEKQPFIVRPTLVWDIETTKAKEYSAKISYLTEGINWNADYIGLLNENDSNILLSGWVTINNKCGKNFENTRLKLMAGDLNIIQPQMDYMQDYVMMEAQPAKRSSFKQQSFFEYHLYDLQRKTTLLNNQIKQIQLFEETTSQIKKTYRVTSYDPEKVSVVILLNNSSDNNLGIPLPGGIIRLYKKIGNDREFIGENQIEHTPKGEIIDIETGKAFDIISERNVMDVTKPSKNSERRKISYSIRNHKESNISVEIMEYFPAYQEIDIHSANGKLLEQKAGSLKYLLDIAAEKEENLNIEYSLYW